MITGQERTNSFTAGVLIALGLCMFLAQSASAADSSRLGHYATVDGSISFVLDRTGETPRQRYDGSPEILLLNPVAATRGDTIYRQSDGKIVLRSTPFGALTYFSASHRTGVPVVRIGEAEPLVAKTWTIEEVAGLGPALQEHLSLDHGMTVEVNVPPVAKLTTQRSIDTLGDAIENTQLAIDRLATGPSQTAEMTRVLKKIRYQIAVISAAKARSGTLAISIDPPRRLAGRPSSYDIADALNDAVAADKAARAAGASGRTPSQHQHSFDLDW
jgi:hypothetical protein